MIKNKVILAIVFVLLFSGLILTDSSLAEDKMESKLQDFVYEVYSKYAQKSFAEIYAVMYPSIQAIVSEEEYVEFQEYQFAKLRLAISEIEVGVVGADPRLPRSLQDILLAEDDLHVYGIEIFYRADFTSGVRLNQTISKIVYVVVDALEDDQFYLLWDPVVIEEEGIEDDGH